MAVALVYGAAGTGCAKPERWDYTGPRVYLIHGDALDESDGLDLICEELEKHEINARTYGPENWLQIVADIDAAPQEEAILVGHGHGAFLATQVARHYAQRGNGKFIEAVIALDAYNKDWPHNAYEAGFREPHSKPMAIPISHSVLRVRNFNQCNPDSRRWGRTWYRRAGRIWPMRIPTIGMTIGGIDGV
ncbi:MAG: hypothetical protein IPK83_05375 [Planctomycetes bacterium]|nr:hypothetical protein [Planctomycetota bacterium]